MKRIARIAICAAVALVALAVAVPAQAAQPAPTPGMYALVVWEAQNPLAIRMAALVEFEQVVLPPGVKDGFNACYVTWITPNGGQGGDWEDQHEVVWHYFDLGPAGAYFDIDESTAGDRPFYNVTGYYTKTGLASFVSADTMLGEAQEWIQIDGLWELAGDYFPIVAFRL